MTGNLMFGRKTLTACVAALGLILSSAPAAEAQFSGPALSIARQANQPQTPTTDPNILIPAGRDPLINPGDVVQVRVFGAVDYSPPVRVSVDGQVQLPLIGLVSIAGLTVIRAEDVIAQRLSSAGMFINPQVTIQVTDAVSQSVTMAGDMHAIIPVAGQRRLLDVIASAGGLPSTSSHVITILRAGQDQPIVVDLGTDPLRSAQGDIPILPGDKIIVSRVGVVYILGAFKTQGAIPLQQNSPLTLMQATALSGGTSFEGKYKDMRLVRTVGLGRTVVKLDISKVLAGKAPDPVLQADDILFLPTSDFKSAVKAGGIGTFTGIVSLLLVVIQSRI